MTMKADIVVIGGGVIGTSVAYNLAKKGKKVILTERNDHATGASGSCDQMIIMQSKNPGIHLEIALASAEMYEDLGKELGHNIEYHKKGGMILIENSEEMKVMQDFVARQKKIGLDVEILDRKDAMKLQRGLAEHLIAATYSPQDAEVNPMELNFAYANAARKLGVEILLETEVTGLLRQGDRVTGVETSRGAIEAEIVVNAAGAWAPDIGRMVGLDIPIKPRRGQIMVTEPVPPFVNKVMLSAMYIVAKYNPDILKQSDSRAVQLGVGLAMTQSDKGNILIGATREFVGYDVKNTPEGIKEVIRNAVRLVPGVKDINLIRTMGGLRPYTPDGLPLLGFVKGVEGFFMAAGHEGDGIALAPITGKIVTDLITEGKTFLDVEAFAPNRFAV